MFLRNLIWRFQSGDKILIGKDNFLSGTEEITIPKSLLTFFHRKGIFFWNGLISRWQGPIPIWCEAESLEMWGVIAMQWNHIRDRLRNCGIFLSTENDSLIWKNLKGMSSIRVKDVYQDLIGFKQSKCNPMFPCIFWKLGCPSKMFLF